MNFVTEHLYTSTNLSTDNLSRLNAFERNQFIQDNGEVTELFIAAHRYNQIAFASNAPIIQNPLIPELAPTRVSIPPKTESSEHPETRKEWRYLSEHTIRVYPGDSCDHGSEAQSIFTSTQLERLVSLIGRVIEFAASLLGIKVDAFQRYHYRSHNEQDTDIYQTHFPINAAKTEPTSYWLGHATLLLNIPLKSQDGSETRTFNVITDPVEGDLNALLYPRMTNFARPMERLPASHVYLLSHNHLDHYDKSAIKKLVAQQPVMIVPAGDGSRYQNMGFQNVVELDWWDEQTLDFDVEGKTYTMKITATPARHWAGQGPCGGHESSFLGYVIQGLEHGDIYFAGDTARLNEAHIQKLKEKFNIRWSFQPGGPDEVRRDMESTHQASVDGLWMQFHMIAETVYQKQTPKNREFFINAMKAARLIYMHTMTYKLGNLHLSDTKDSVEKVIRALERGTPDPTFKSYESQVYHELIQIGSGMIFEDDNPLSPAEIADILRASVAIPKIGSRLGLDSPLQRNDLFGPN